MIQKICIIINNNLIKKILPMPSEPRNQQFRNDLNDQQNQFSIQQNSDIIANQDDHFLLCQESPYNNKNNNNLQFEQLSFSLSSPSLSQNTLNMSNQISSDRGNNYQVYDSELQVQAQNVSQEQLIKLEQQYLNDLKWLSQIFQKRLTKDEILNLLHRHRIKTQDYYKPIKYRIQGEKNFYSFIFSLIKQLKYGRKKRKHSYRKLKKFYQKDIQDYQLQQNQNQTFDKRKKNYQRKIFSLFAQFLQIKELQQQKQKRKKIIDSLIKDSILNFIVDKDLQDLLQKCFQSYINLLYMKSNDQIVRQDLKIFNLFDEKKLKQLQKRSIKSYFAMAHLCHIKLYGIQYNNYCVNIVRDVFKSKFNSREDIYQVVRSRKFQSIKKMKDFQQYLTDWVKQIKKDYGNQKIKVNKFNKDFKSMVAQKIENGTFIQRPDRFEN